MRPQEFSENLLWRLPAEESFTAFCDFVRASANDVLSHRGKLGKPLNNLDTEEPEDPEVIRTRLKSMAHPWPHILDHREFNPFCCHCVRAKAQRQGRRSYFSCRN